MHPVHRRILSSAFDIHGACLKGVAYGLILHSHSFKQKPCGFACFCEGLVNVLRSLIDSPLGSMGLILFMFRWSKCSKHLLCLSVCKSTRQVLALFWLHYYLLLTSIDYCIVLPIWWAAHSPHRFASCTHLIVLSKRCWCPEWQLVHYIASWSVLSEFCCLFLAQVSLMPQDDEELCQRFRHFEDFNLSHSKQH